MTLNRTTVFLWAFVVALGTTISVSGCGTTAERRDGGDSSAFEDHRSSKLEEKTLTDNVHTNAASDGNGGFDIGRLAADFPGGVVPLIDGDIPMSVDMVMQAAKLWKVTVVPVVATDDLRDTVQSQFVGAGFAGEWGNYLGDDVALYSKGNVYQVIVQLTASDDGSVSVSYAVTEKFE